MSDQQGQTPQWPPQQPFQQPPYRQQQSSYTQPTQAHPGQFQQPPYNSFPPQQKRQGLWGWYNPRTRTVKLSLGCAAILAMLLVPRDAQRASIAEEAGHFLLASAQLTGMIQQHIFASHDVPERFQCQILSFVRIQ